jgi:hypothetical protein
MKLLYPGYLKCCLLGLLLLSFYNCNAQTSFARAVTDSAVHCTGTDTINLFSGLCAGDSVYFYGTYIRHVGTYDTLISGACDTMVILTLVVQDPLPPTYLYDTICANELFLFNGVYLDTTGVYTAHFNNTNSCDSTVILRLTVNALPVVTLFWDSMIGREGFFAYNGDTVYCHEISNIVIMAGGNPPFGTYTGPAIINKILD